MSPPVPTSDVTEAIRRCSRDQRAQIVLEPARAVDVADEARDLDLVHREDHAARPAPPSELEPRRGHVRDPEPAAAELLRHECGERTRLLQRVECLARKPRLLVDVVGVQRRDLVGDPPDFVDERRRRSSIVAIASFDPQACERAGDRVDALERAPCQHLVGKLDVELLLEREHHVDARV